MKPSKSYLISGAAIFISLSLMGTIHLIPYNKYRTIIFDIYPLFLAASLATSVLILAMEMLKGITASKNKWQVFMIFFITSVWICISAFSLVIISKF